MGFAARHDLNERREGHSAAIGRDALVRSVLSSGLQEPQLVPAQVASPKAATLFAPFAMAANRVFRPTLKQEQTVAPLSG